MARPYFLLMPAPLSKTSLNCPLQKLEDRTLDYFLIWNLPFTEVKAADRSARCELHIPFLCKCKQLVLVPGKSGRSFFLLNKILIIFFIIWKKNYFIIKSKSFQTLDHEFYSRVCVENRNDLAILNFSSTLRIMFSTLKLCPQVEAQLNQLINSVIRMKKRQ